MNEMIDCYQLEIARDIPIEFVSLENNYQSLLKTHKNIKGMFIGIGIGLSMFFIYKTYFYENKKEQH